jgi:7,8-dihydropterin-6-yl-methyl-4-(beta-D-ribofuranosyl)aminobenzene 5'-phosphate synthase
MTNIVRVTVLVENTAQGMGMLGEHGLAWWIEWDGRRLLFDTGQGAVLVSNAYKLGAAIRQCDAVALSHGHYDHTGGLADVLRNNQPLPVYLHPAALEPKYARPKQGASREIGIPFPARRALREHALEVVATESPTTLWDGLTLTGPVPRTTDFEDTGGPFFLDEACSKPDPLLDDQSLFFEADGGIVVLLGCAHSGVVNTLRYVRELCGGKPFRAVLGGMHLVAAQLDRVERTIEEFRRLEVEQLAPGHCTGPAAVAALWNAFPGRCATCHVGARFKFERAEVPLR